jgi:hypothetical protein
LQYCTKIGREEEEKAVEILYCTKIRREEKKKRRKEG